MWYGKAAAQGHWTALIALQMIKLDGTLQRITPLCGVIWEWRARMFLWTIALAGAAGFVGCVVVPVWGVWWVVSSAAAATAHVVRALTGVIGGAGRGLSKARGAFAFGRVERRPSDRSGKCKVGRCRLTVANPVLTALTVSALVTGIPKTAFNVCFQFQLVPPQQGVLGAAAGGVAAAVPPRGREVQVDPRLTPG